MPERACLAYQDHNGGDGARSREHGNAERNDAGIFLRCGLFGIAQSFLRGRPAGFEHIETNQQKNQAPCNFKGRESDAEESKDKLACGRKTGQYDEAGDRAFAGIRFRLVGTGAVSDGKKRWDRGKGSTVMRLA